MMIHGTLLPVMDLLAKQKIFIERLEFVIGRHCFAHSQSLRLSVSVCSLLRPRFAVITHHIRKNHLAFRRNSLKSDSYKVILIRCIRIYHRRLNNDYAYNLHVAVSLSLSASYSLHLHRGSEVQIVSAHTRAHQHKPIATLTQIIAVNMFAFWS